MLCRSRFLKLVIAAFLLKGCAVAGMDVDTGVGTDTHASDAAEEAVQRPDGASADVLDASTRDTGVAMDVVADTGVDIPVPIDTGIDVPIDTGCTSSLVINEVQTGSATSAADEFVEIFNTGTCTMQLVGWTLRYEAATGTTASVKWTGVAGNQITGNGYVVFGGASYTGSTIGTLAGSTGTLAAAGGSVGLYDPSGTRVDSVGYGTATNSLVEGTAAPAPANGQSIQRFPNGVDTDQNSVDFHAATPTAGAANH